MRAEHLRNIDVQRASAAAARAAIATLDAQIASLRQNFRKAAADDLTTANDQVGLATGDVRKAVRLRQFKELRAPVDGVVQQLVVTTIGGVVQPAQPLMAIVPCRSAVAASCRGGIEVEAFIQNRDIGFVRAGQRVAVKLEAFDFAEYGLIEGEVRYISRDAIEQQAAQNMPGSTNDRSPERPSGLVYSARISLNCAAGSRRRSPLCDRLQPGLAVQAEIKTDRRRIIQYLLSPIGRTVREAGRER
jgi:hemolysin D